MLIKKCPRRWRAAWVCTALFAALPALAAPPAVKTLTTVSGEATLYGQESLMLQVTLDAPAPQDMKIALRISSTERPMVTAPSAILMPRGRDRTTFAITRLPAAFAAASNQTVTIVASSEGQRAGVNLPVLVRAGIPDTPVPCNTPQAYRLHVQGSSTSPVPTRLIGTAAPSPTAIAVSGEPYTVNITLDCAVRTAYPLPLTLMIGTNTSADPLLTNAERVAGSQAAFAGFPASLVVPANQRGVTVTLTAGDTLIGGLANLQGPESLIAVRSGQTSNSLRITPHPRCLHTFTLIAPATVFAGASLRPRISRPCISPEVNGASGEYQFAFETSDAIALPVPLGTQYMRGTEYNDQRAVRTLTAGNVTAPTRVELRVVKVSGPPLAAPIAPVSILVSPR